MKAINSTTILEKLELISGTDGQTKVDIAVLAQCMDIQMPALVSVLTELEHRDEITLEIISAIDATTNEPVYSGTVQLMGKQDVPVQEGQ